MTTSMRLLPVRVSPALRGLIDQVGPVNPATRALLLLGAAAAGLELSGLEREDAALVTCAHLDRESVGLTDTAGLDLLGGAAVWCHYRAADDPQIEALVARFTMPVLAISERAGIAREGDELRSVGYEAASRFTAAGRERIAPGERLHI